MSGAARLAPDFHAFLRIAVAASGWPSHHFASSASLRNSPNGHGLLGFRQRPIYRLIKVKRATGVTGAETHIAFSYPSLTQVVTQQDQNSLDDGVITTTGYYDGLLRKSDTQRSLGSGCAFSVKQSYDGKGARYRA
jgi:hypothetical protein